MDKLQAAVLQTLAYADIFDYPLSAEEIHKFLIGQYVIRYSEGISRSEQTQDEIKKELAKNPYLLSRITYHDGFYCLKGREKIVAIRKKREKWSQKKMEIVRRTAGWLKLIPTIKMVAVTGALAMENSEEKDDIDLLIVTAEDWLWLTRLLTVFLVELVAKRRRPEDKEVKDKICLNMFLDESRLKIPNKEQDLFSAHEVCQLKPLWDRNKIYQKFIKNNSWIGKYLPNWTPQPASRMLGVDNL